MVVPLALRPDFPGNVQALRHRSFAQKRGYLVFFIYFNYLVDRYGKMEDI